MRVLNSKGCHYGIFLSFGFHWALLACIRWSLGTFGLPWVPMDGHWASICHLWGSIGAALGHHWAPFVAFGVPLGFLSVSLGFNFGCHFSIFVNVRTFVVYGISWRKQHNKGFQVWVEPNICGSKWRIRKKYFPPKRNIDVVCIFVGVNALRINSFTRLLWRTPNFTIPNCLQK